MKVFCPVLAYNAVGKFGAPVPVFDQELILRMESNSTILELKCRDSLCPVIEELF